MSKPYIRDTVLDVWVTFPSEQARRLFVGAGAVVRTLTNDADDQAQRLRQIAKALNGVESSEEPQA
jgi:hypothetical protein